MHIAHVLKYKIFMRTHVLCLRVYDPTIHCLLEYKLGGHIVRQEKCDNFKFTFWFRCI